MLKNALSPEELKKYVEAEKQKIIEEYGILTEETIREFIKNHGAEKFHEEYFKKHDFGLCFL